MTEDKDLPDIHDMLPECGIEGCPAPAFNQGFGLAGGGYGVYLYCTVCDRVVAKSHEPGDIEL